MLPDGALQRSPRRNGLVDYQELALAADGLLRNRIENRWKKDDADRHIDVEASGFGRGSYPIEVGVALPMARAIAT